MSDPGSIIAIITIAYAGASRAWSVFQDSLHYPDESADLVVRLELERFRLQTWAGNAGIGKGTFCLALHPVHSLVADRLRRVEELFENAHNLQDSFGLLAQGAAKLKPGPLRAKGIVSGMAQSMRVLGIKLDIDEKASQSPDALKRIRWGITSKSKFEKLVATIEMHVNKLDDILTESQRKSTNDDRNRVNIVVVGQVDENALKIISDAVHGGAESVSPASLKQLGALVEKRAITMPGISQLKSKLKLLEPQSLHDYHLPADYAEQSRFISIARHADPLPARPKMLLFERKGYDEHLSVHDNLLLKARLERLILLLSSPSTDNFRVFTPIGYSNDPQNYCWWMIFDFPTNELSISSDPLSSLKLLVQHVSLHSILVSSKSSKPPLEQRFKLGYKFAQTLGELYSSNWMHKSIRSANILFPQSTWLHDGSGPPKLKSFHGLSFPYISGFEFSRQDTEAVTIDKGKHVGDVESSLYRHPEYQGEAAGGYKMHFDFYSFGMVLLEIALWAPLSSFLDPIGERQPANESRLSSGMKYFHRDEALVLQRGVLARIDKEMAFRVGTRYSDALRWCLTLVPPEEEEEQWHPALRFYNHVVVPLEKCAVALDD